MSSGDLLTPGIMTESLVCGPVEKSYIEMDLYSIIKQKYQLPWLVMPRSLGDLSLSIPASFLGQFRSKPSTSDGPHRGIDGGTW